MIKRFDVEGHSFEITVEIRERGLQKDGFIPMHKIKLTNPNANFSTYKEVPTDKIKSLVTTYMTKVAPDWVAAYDLRGRQPTKEDLLLIELGFEEN